MSIFFQKIDSLIKEIVMKLYYFPGSCAFAVHVILIETGQNYTLELVDLSQQPIKTANGQLFTEINPKGYVPALLTSDQQVLTETQVILQYLADQAPEKALIPASNTWARYKAQEWLAFIATELHKGFSIFWDSTATNEQKEVAKTKLFGRFTTLNEQLSHQNYIMGQFSVVDVYVLVQLMWAKYHQFDLSEFSHLMAFDEQMRKRPAVHQALQEEGLI